MNITKLLFFQMMQLKCEIKLPTRKPGENNNTRMYNALLSKFEELNVSFQSDQVQAITFETSDRSRSLPLAFAYARNLVYELDLDPGKI